MNLRPAERDSRYAYCVETLELDIAKVNVNGGAM
jgi:hypothetical protein